MKRELMLVGLLAIVGALLPLAVYPGFALQLLCFWLYAAAFNLLFGYVGLLSVGHAAFFGAAAYVTGHALKSMGVDAVLAIAMGTAVATSLGVLIGYLSIKRQGLYFAMITLALAQVLYFYAVQASWTGGDDGLQSVPRAEAFGSIDLTDDLRLYAIVLVVVLLGIWTINRIVASPVGEILRGIKDNEARMASLGYETGKYKLFAFAVSAFFCGLAGALKVIVTGVATLTDVSFHSSAEVLLMVLVGGVGTGLGPIVGASLLLTLQTYLVALGPWLMVIQGAVFVFCVLAFRDGIVGSISAILQKASARSNPNPD
ncbi:branched-chain amino acid ABC transporter permease [Hydrogenophaga sp.]|uniref:branched-chain amino acid ABC transporter permease n=1 Tax=Hydrogenophaga sp. TaxID=1904254 RepID=UPI00271A3CB6|nr:branched-chain amino acid ABC transporter permease [Hydrogenophaga sp.]MDO9435988.1 branched-chain amino acid ABC transporter permease [Hydrogenophaga sp.]